MRSVTQAPSVLPTEKNNNNRDYLFTTKLFQTTSVFLRVQGWHGEGCFVAGRSLAELAAVSFP